MPVSARHFVQTGYAGPESGIHQPVGHLRGGQEQAGEVEVGVLTTPMPVLLRVGVAG